MKALGADVVVIGAGIMGVATAFHLAEAGVDVLVVDRAGPGSEASGVNAGTLALQNKKTPMIPMAIEAARTWAEMGRLLDADVGYVRCGGIRVAESEAEALDLAKAVADQQALGLDVSLLDPPSLREMRRFLGPGVVAASYCPADGFGNPLVATRAFARAAERRGARFLLKARVTAIRTAADGLRVETSQGTLTAGRLVNAAGVWAGQVAALLGIQIPIRCDVNQLLISHRCPPILPRVITHIRGNLTLKQLPVGSVIVGGGWQGRGGLDGDVKELDVGNLAGNLRLATRVVPALRRLTILRAWSGFEGVSLDALPLCGPVRGVEGFYVVACARGGFTLGPVLGRLVAELLTSGRTSLPIDAYDPLRFGEGPGGAEAAAPEEETGARGEDE